MTRRKRIEADIISEALKEVSDYCIRYYQALYVQRVFFESDGDTLRVFADGENQNGEMLSDREIGIIKEDFL